MVERTPLSAGLGALRPPVLSGIETAALHWAGGSVQRLEDAFDEVFGVLPCGTEVIAADTPPEIVPLVSSGREGPHFGYLVRAPELGGVDAPIVSFGSGLALRPFARTTREALSRLALIRFEQDEDADPDLTESLAAALGLTQPDAPSASLEPEIPVGYRWRPGRDGVGVLAPTARFGDDAVPNDEGLSLSEIDAWTERLLYEGLSAAACAVLRDAFTTGYAQPATWTALARGWAQSYEALGRPGLAEQVRLRSGRFG